MTEWKRMNRRWSQLTAADVQMIADRTDGEARRVSGFGKQYAPEYSNVLVGKTIRIKLDGGRAYEYAFSDMHTLTWKQTGADAGCQDYETHKEFCEVMLAPGAENIVFCQHYVEGSKPPQSRQIAIDIDTGLVTMCITRIGVPESPIECAREFGFGILDGYEDKGARHGFTEELVGNAIYWSYGDGDIIKVKHIYSAPLYYTYSMVAPGGNCWMASNPADYVKLADHVYMFAFTEERQAGYQGLFVINTEQLHDIAAFFGVNANGLFCSTTGAVGERADAYAWDMCNTREDPEER